MGSRIMAGLQNTIRERFIFSPILAHFDFGKDIIVETDALDYTSARLLSHMEKIRHYTLWLNIPRNTC
jgi:hypothetical protein